VAGRSRAARSGGRVRRPGGREAEADLGLLRRPGGRMAYPGYPDGLPRWPTRATYRLPTRPTKSPGGYPGRVPPTYRLPPTAYRALRSVERALWKA
jgi:hypothetical protein